MEAKKLQCIFNLWGHSREEDGEGLTVYRPRGFQFPLARGRDWIEFRADGTVQYLGTGPDDRSRAIIGYWRDIDDNKLEIRKGSDPKLQHLIVVYCDEHVLKVRWE